MTYDTLDLNECGFIYPIFGISIHLIMKTEAREVGLMVVVSECLLHIHSMQAQDDGARRTRKSSAERAKERPTMDFLQATFLTSFLESSVEDFHFWS